MTKFSKLLLAATSILALTACQDDQATEFLVENPMAEAVQDAALIISDQDIIGKFEPASLVVLDNGGQVVYGQIDDLDHDGKPDEAVFLMDLSVEETGAFKVMTTDVTELKPRTKVTISVLQNGQFNDEGVYVSEGGYGEVNNLTVPEQQEQDSKLAYMEGPLWESDKVGFRYYLDDRNRYDVFGKSAPEMALHKITGDYHAISDWGTDVLKVGKSMGLGSIAMMTENGPHFISDVQSKILDIRTNGPLRSILRTEYKGWLVEGRSLNVTSDLEIRGGANWTEQRLSVTGNEGRKMVTGIVKHPAANDVFTGQEDGIFFAYTWGKQSEQKDFLGMAVLVPQKYSPELVEGDPHSHLVTYDLNGGNADYRFMAGWEHEVVPFKTREEFEAAVRKAARHYANPLTYSVSK